VTINVDLDKTAAPRGKYLSEDKWLGSGLDFEVDVP
jgi:hypothetical protein